MVPPMVLGLAGALGVAGVVTFAVGDVPDYADLVPAPDSIIWERGQESTMLLSTNREDVEMRIHSVALGIANVQGAVPHSGELMVLGASVGCQDWAVSRFTADAISTGGYTLKGNIDRDNFTSTAQVYLRSRVQGETDWGGVPGSPVGVDYDANDLPASNRFELSLSVSNELFEVEASSDSGFPVALTRFITIDTTASTATVDEEAESLVLLHDTAVGLVACSEHEDVVVTLTGEESAQLNRYVVDIGPAATATPAPTPTPNPDAGYVERAVCVDVQNLRADYLSGGESVGAAFAASDFGLSGTLDSVELGDLPGGEPYRYFFDGALTAGSYRVTVNAAGAGDTQGLAGELVYPVRLTAVDDAGELRYLDVGVWLDTGTLSTAGNGLC